MPSVCICEYCKVEGPSGDFLAPSRRFCSMSCCKRYSAEKRYYPYGKDEEGIAKAIREGLVNANGKSVRQAAPGAKQVCVCIQDRCNEGKHISPYWKFLALSCTLDTCASCFYPSWLRAVLWEIRGEERWHPSQRTRELLMEDPLQNLWARLCLWSALGSLYTVLVCWLTCNSPWNVVMHPNSL